MTDVVIPQRFVGPPGSANGGYTCGLLAGVLGGASAVVTLRRPTPVERRLQVAHSQSSVVLSDGDVLIAEATEPDAEQLALDLPDPLSFEAAVGAAAQFDMADYVDRHPFPGCFTCGPTRAPGDGLRIFPAATRHRFVASPWVPAGSLAGADGLVDPVYLWAAMDCPSGMSRFDATLDWEPALLGRMAAVVHRSPVVGEQLVVAGWPVALDGRKRSAGSVVWGADGEVLAHNRATWIVVDDEQLAAFRAPGGG